MAEVGSAYVTVLPSARGFGRATEAQIGGEMHGSGKRLGGLLANGMKAGLVGVAVIGAAATAWVASSVKSLARIERINAQTAAAISSTGGVAGVTAKHVENLAGSLENLTATEAETVQEGANLLLTFTNIRNGVGKDNQIFDRATTSIVDMSRALGQDTKSSAIQLGKALNDPIKGVTALQRVGVSFTADQKEQIKTMVATGRTMDAQKLILKELETEFGGSGEAFAKTTEGQIALAKHAFGTLGETIAAGLLPPLGKVAGFTARLLNDMAANVGPFVDKVKGMFSGLGGAGGTSMLSTLADLFTQRLIPAAQQFVTWWGANVLPVLIRIGQIIMTQVVPIVVSLADWFVRTATQIASALRPAFEALYAVFQTQILPAINNLLSKFREWQPVIQQVVGFILVLAATILGKVLPVLIRFAGYIIGTVVRVLTVVIGAVVGVVSALIRVGGAFVDAARDAGRFLSGVKEKVGEALTFLGTLPGKVKALFAGAIGWLAQAGRDIVQGLVNGIRGMGSVIKDALLALIPGPLKKFAGALGLGSPSTVFRDFGIGIGQGLAQGIESTIGLVGDAVTRLADASTGIPALASIPSSIPPEMTRTYSAQINGVTSPLGEEMARLRAEVIALRQEVATHPARTGAETAKSLNQTAAAASRRRA